MKLLANLPSVKALLQVFDPTKASMLGNMCYEPNFYKNNIYLLPILPKDDLTNPDNARFVFEIIPNDKDNGIYLIRSIMDHYYISIVSEYYPTLKTTNGFDKNSLFQFYEDTLVDSYGNTLPVFYIYSPTANAWIGASYIEQEDTEIRNCLCLVEEKDRVRFTIGQTYNT